jgi:hypothetical protein
MSRVLVVALLSLAVAACGETAGPSATPDEGALSLRVRQLYDISEGVYVEGAYSYVRVEDASGNTIVEKRLGDGRQLDDDTLVSATTLRLDPGTYRLVAYQRPCEGNCSMLDPPTDRCAREITVGPDGPPAVTIDARPAEPCTIETQS